MKELRLFHFKKGLRDARESSLPHTTFTLEWNIFQLLTAGIHSHYYYSTFTAQHMSHMPFKILSTIFPMWILQRGRGVGSSTIRALTASVLECATILQQFITKFKTQICFSYNFLWVFYEIWPESGHNPQHGLRLVHSQYSRLISLSDSDSHIHIYYPSYCRLVIKFGKTPAQLARLSWI